MTDTTEGAPAPAPKKRSLFKRAAWQDAPKEEGENDDIFSHANEFKNIVAEQNRREEEKRKKASEERKRKHGGQSDSKRRKVSSDHDEPILPGSGSGSAARATRTSSKARSRTPLSPAPSKPPPDSLSSRYDTLTRSTSSNNHIIDLGDSDDDDNDSSYVSKSFNGNSAYEVPLWRTDHKQDMAVRPSKHVTLIDDDDDDDELEEVMDPALAALAAKARERAAAAANPTTGEPAKAPVVQLLISPEIPGAKPLVVKVRIDSTLEKTRLAWCGKQGYSPIMTKDVFFTWKGTRVYDSTTIKRLGIEVDANGNVSIEGDTNIYDDAELPKVYVEAWTPQLFKQHEEQEAAEAAAKKKAREPPPEIEERDPTPEPASKLQKFRLTMKAKGKEDFKLAVHPETTFAHIASAYKGKRGVVDSQPITLMFDGDRLAPMDTVADSELEDMDSIDVLFN